MRKSVMSVKLLKFVLFFLPVLLVVVSLASADSPIRSVAFSSSDSNLVTTDTDNTDVFISRFKEDDANEEPDTNEDEGLQGTSNIKVLSLRYIPLDENGEVDIANTGDWKDKSVDNLRHEIQFLQADTAQALSDGTKYHGYKDTNAPAALDYTIVDELEFLKLAPVDNKPRLDDVPNICKYVDDQGIREVWIWRYHIDGSGPIESNMSMGNNIQQYWNHGSYGDLSNSSQTKDLPICNNTYTVYEYNYGRGIDCSIENHTHQYERVFKWVDHDMFWTKWAGITHDGPSRPIDNPGCGWTHYPPNGQTDYDWENETEVYSDCENWKPDGTGEKVIYSCSKLGGGTCPRDGGTTFKKWWMQNIPGLNNGLSYNGNNFRSWWDFISNFDAALFTGGKSFFDKDFHTSYEESETE
jgi:hypothetical protein